MNRQRLAELFDQAVELPLPERTAWIEQACGGDAELHAELARLLQADARAAAFLETPPALVAAVIGTADAAGEALPEFGAWRALRRIGAGGMGEVWLAERIDGEFDQRAAVKQLAWPTPGLLQRFRQERQILARLQHPDIARLIDGGVDARGAPYLVMEYVDGVPVTQFVRENALDLRARLRLFLRICAAVQYAHQNLVVHRDLKPSNILVAGDGALKLLDFGIAKVLATTDPAEHTQTAARLLTPDYAAPEQFSGGAITTATDVYALGVLLYELLTDARPPRRAFAAGQDSAELPAPSAVVNATTGAVRRRALRGDLDRIALTALAADPARRYPTAEALAGDVLRYCNGQPISARRDSRWYRLRKFARRNRYALAAAVFVGAVCIAAAAISLHQAQLARAQARQAAAVQQFMSGVFAQANPDENKGEPISARQLLEKGEQQLERMRAASPALQIDVTAMLARLYGDMGDYARAEVLLQRALAGVDDAAVPDDVRGRVLVGMATLEAENKDAYESGLAHARAGLAALERAGERNWEEIAGANRIIALCLIRRREDEAAIAALQAAIPLHESMLGSQRSEALANEYVLLGVALGDMSRFDAAQAAFERGAAMLRALSGDSSTRVGYALNEEASMLYQKGDLARAEALHREVTRINRERLGPDNISTLASTFNLLGDIEGQGRIAEALPQRLALLDQAVAAPGLSALRKAHHYDAVAIDYRELGRFAESEELTRKALALIVAGEGADSRPAVLVQRHLGVVLALRGRYAEAEALFREALAVMLKAGSPTSLMACGLRRDIGSTLAQQHRHADAIAQLSALTTDACMVGLADGDAWRPQALADLSLAQLDNGDVAAATATARQALDYGNKALRNSYLLALPLYAAARVKLAGNDPGAAEALLRQALALRTSVHPAGDPRVLEVDVALVEALSRLNRTDEALALRDEIEALLLRSATPYADELRKRLPAR